MGKNEQTPIDNTPTPRAVPVAPEVLLDLLVTKLTEKVMPKLGDSTPDMPAPSEQTES